MMKAFFVIFLLFLITKSSAATAKKRKTPDEAADLLASPKASVRRNEAAMGTETAKEKKKPSKKADTEAIKAQVRAVKTPNDAAALLMSPKASVRRVAAAAAATGTMGEVPPVAVLEQLVMLLSTSDAGNANEKPVMLALRKATLGLLRNARENELFKDPGAAAGGTVINALSSHMIFRSMTRLFDLDLVRAALKASVLDLRADTDVWDGAPREAWLHSGGITPHDYGNDDNDGGARMSVLRLLVAEPGAVVALMRGTLRLPLHSAAADGFATTPPRAAARAFESVIRDGRSLKGLYAASETFRRVTNDEGVISVGSFKEDDEPLPLVCYADATAAVDGLLAASLDALFDAVENPHNNDDDGSGGGGGGGGDDDDDEDDDNDEAGATCADSDRWLAAQLSSVWADGNSVLDALAAAGQWRAFETVVARAVLGIIPADYCGGGGGEALAALRKACVRVGPRGRTPAHHAARVWGADSPILASVARCVALDHSALPLDGSPPEMTSALWNALEANVGASFDGVSVSPSAGAGSEAVNGPRRDVIVGVDEADRSDGSDSSGGWRRWRGVDNDETDALPPGADVLDDCDVEQLVGVSVDDESGAAALLRAGQLGRPTVLRGAAAAWDGREKLRREQLGAFVGSMSVSGALSAAEAEAEAATATTATTTEKPLTLEEYVTKLDTAASAASAAAGAKNAVLQCAFQDATDELSARKLKGIHPRALVALDVTDSARAQLFVGGRGAGGPLSALHFDALHVLAWGRTRWWLYPPAHAAMASSQQPAHAALWRRDASLRRGNATAAACGIDSLKATPHEVMQEAGDALFVPCGWGRMAVHLEESIGIAYELRAWKGAEGLPERSG